MTPADRRLLRARLDVALWPIPAVLTVLAAVLAELVSRIPTDTAQTLLVLPDFGPSTALAVLSAIATGMLTFTGLVAAVILLALQFGASQLSPRLLRTLVGRSPAKWALGVSIAAFVYSLLVIGEVSPQGSSASVPALAVEVAIVLVIAAIGASLYLLHATTQALRVARVATEVAHKGMTVIEEAYPHAAGDALVPPPALPDGAPAVVAWHGHPGVIAGIELRPLVALATRENLVVELIPAVGDSLETGSDVMRVWGPGATGGLTGMIVVSDERTFEQDPMFAFRILVDVAIRALSPAINDPTTATQCLHRIQALLAAVGCRAAGGRRRDRRVRCDPCRRALAVLGRLPRPRALRDPACRRRAVPGRPPHARPARSPGGGLPGVAPRGDRPPSRRARRVRPGDLPAGSRPPVRLRRRRAGRRWRPALGLTLPRTGDAANRSTRGTTGAACRRSQAGTDRPP